MEPKKLTREQVEQIVREAREKKERPDLKGANLKGVDLSQADLIRADLIRADLTGAKFIGANLSGADLSRAILTGADLAGAFLIKAKFIGANLIGAKNLHLTFLDRADLSRANLSGADLIRAHLNEADLSQADLSQADLKGANLERADLSQADLSQADLSQANLSQANLTETKLDSTNLTNAIINRTSFIEVDLSQAKGLTEVDHQGPSIIDLNTIYQSKDKIPAIFLEKAGVHPDIIRWQHSLHTLPTVFICYSHHDEREKDLLVTHLSVLKQLGTLDIWDDSQITGGADWKQEILKAITRSTVAILLVSANFLSSKVINALEIPQFLERQTRDENFVIYPIIIKPCSWPKFPWLEKLEVRPKGGKPIWGGKTKIDAELSKIADEVEGIIKDRWWKAFR